MTKRSKQIHMQSGQVVILTTLIFLAVSAFLVYAIINPVISSHRATEAFMNSKQSFLLANSAAEETLYRMKNQMNMPSSETLVLGAGSAQISLAETLEGTIISIESDVDSYFRSLQLGVEESEGVNFHYGLQSGRGGFIMSGGARINGNVYANGDILGSGGPIITGAATVATRSLPTAEVAHGTVFPPTYSLNFGGNTTPQDMAQSFTVSTSTPISSARIYIKRQSSGWMNNITLRVTADNGGKPHKTTLASATLPYGQITTSYNYLSTPFSTPLELTPGNTYWIVMDTSTTWGSYYSLGATQGTYGNGVAKTGQWSQGNGGTWSDSSPAGLDIYFDLYTGGDTGLISGVTIGQDGGDVWAHEVNNTTAYDTIYCQAASGNNKACDTSRPDPTEQPMPISDGNIEAWKSEATVGGTYVGDRSYGGADEASLGPEKIEGDLYVGAGATLSVTGTLYVTGDVTVTGGGIIKLDTSYGVQSGIIVTDGNVTAGGGGNFEGSGVSGSYLLVVTTSECPDAPGCSGDNAIDVSGGTGSVVLNAQKGTLEFTGGASAKQATADTIIMSGGTVVDYETGLANIDFESGPSGGFSITGWDEI